MHPLSHTYVERGGQDRTGQEKCSRRVFRSTGGSVTAPLSAVAAALLWPLSKRVMWSSDGTGSVKSVPSEFLFHSVNVS